MYFLHLLGLYVLVFVVSMILCYCRSYTPVECFFSALSKFGSYLIPSAVSHFTWRIIDYVLYTRNCVMQIMFICLVLGGNIILIQDVLPILYFMKPDVNHCIVPMTLLCIHGAFYYLMCISNAGVITQKTVDKFNTVYSPDGFIYPGKVICKTCKFIKPARSKHCGICDRCIHKFDHHCLWVNNCIGGFNAHYFVAFLMSVFVMSFNGVWMGTDALMLLAEHFRLYEASFVDSTGKIRPITLTVMIQHLFIQNSRAVFLVLSLGAFLLLLGSFIIYHLFLFLSNQTTNERSKYSHFYTRTPNKKHVNSILNTLPYNCGIKQNLYEALLPKQFMDYCIKKKRRSHPLIKFQYNTQS